ncbi:CobW family GTP-binding protein [Niallia oryzisoli]|uniref:CobW family GTP-binding protein n=1 Tax=Niallia oryzisoli TaxID=1737571 RepID=UPI00373567A9
MKPSIPIYLLTGYLGSGKTTLLKNTLSYFSHIGKKAAVIMNEVGEINVDGYSLETDTPVAEILGGCICCSVSGDLKNTIIQVCEDYTPDVIIIESTGVALPRDTISAITEASLYIEVELKSNVTVIDAHYLLELMENKGRTYQMIKEQIFYGDILILNKMDRVPSEKISELKNTIHHWNSNAVIQTTTHCKVSFDFLDETISRSNPIKPLGSSKHSSHNHVMVYTHYFDRPIERQTFEDLIKTLPQTIYRAKGILHFKDTNGPMVFQYAYKELEMIRMTAKSELTNVAVFIGERFSKEKLIKLIEEHFVIKHD